MSTSTQVFSLEQWYFNKKLDKGSDVVVLDKSDYILKMEKILDNLTKFKLISPPCDFDDTVKVEFKIRQLQQLRKDGLLPPSVYKAIRSTRSQRPRLYGLPKTHKEDLLLRPTLSMIDSTQHSLAKLLTSILDPILLLYFTNWRVSDEKLRDELFVSYLQILCYKSLV